MRERFDRRVTEQCGEGTVEYRFRRDAKQVRRIRAYLHDVKARRVERHEHTVGLDRARDMDRFDVAGGDVRQGHGACNESSSQVVSVSNVAIAARIASSVAIVDERSTCSPNRAHIAPVVGP